MISLPTRAYTNRSVCRKPDNPKVFRLVEFQCVSSNQRIEPIRVEIDIQGRRVHCDWTSIRPSNITTFAKARNGYLLTAHSNLAADEPDQPGFSWDLPFGAKTIGEMLAGTCSLRLVKELRTPLYRIQLFRRNVPEVIELAQPTPPPLDIAADIVWDGGSFQRKEAIQAVFTDRLPILKYRRVAPISPSVPAGYQVSPTLFKEQIESVLMTLGDRHQEVARIPSPD